MSTNTNLLYHIIYSTKYRRPWIRSEWQDELYAYIGGIVRANEGTLLRVGGVADHVHLLVRLNPTIAISDVMRVVKANSSKWVNERDDVDLRFQWQSGFAAFSVSESQVGAVENYIAEQVEHHRVKTFEEEFLEILKKHGVEYDGRYVFEQETL